MKIDPWFPADAFVPDGLERTEFILRPLVVRDCDRDYEAVIASRHILLKRSQGDWPREGFTWQENYEDLDRHEREHRARAAFTYTLMAADESLCLGCVYLLPLQKTLMAGGVDPEIAAAKPPLAAKVSFWVRPEGHENGLDRRLLAALQDWLAGSWPIPEYCFEVSEINDQMLALVEGAGLERRFTLRYEHKPNLYYLFR